MWGVGQALQPGDNSPQPHAPCRAVAPLPQTVRNDRGILRTSGTTNWNSNPAVQNMNILFLPRLPYNNWSFLCHKIRAYIFIEQYRRDTRQSWPEKFGFCSYLWPWLPWPAYTGMVIYCASLVKGQGVKPHPRPLNVPLISKHSR